ncbi:RHS repeat-associated core domain-containing protein [Cystobacter fuscus]|uniref:RHS repeat-associated core domain-containing protein n=1 Tax=Cystobacter fuscus TaxID=43 RepID=UPI0012DFDA46|nr:RHS repeat-associated core domain-containing protein [Cystobacter fuscus]
MGTCGVNTAVDMISSGGNAQPSGPIVMCHYSKPTPEMCDGIDNDCNGLTDDGCSAGPGGGGPDGGVDLDGGSPEPDGGNGSPGNEICHDEVDNNHNGEVDEDCPPGELDGGGPPDCVGQCCELSVADPVNIATGTSSEVIEDLRITDGLTTLTFERVFSSRADEWIYDAPLVGVPKPFGASPVQPQSVEWWHNWLSVVVEHQHHWSVRTRQGGLLRFLPCTGGVPCEARPVEGNASRSERLTRTATGYELRHADGTRSIYDARFVASTGSRNRYFLSRWLSPTGKALANLSYAVPDDATGCPQGASGTQAGVPYLSSVRTEAGGSLVFNYQALTGSGGETECVISSVERGLALPTGAMNREDVVYYSYVSEGGAQRPGRLAHASYEARGSSERYAYSWGAFGISRLGAQLVRHQYGADGRVASATGEGYGAAIAWEPTTGSCEPGSNCCGRTPLVRQVTDSFTGRGDGSEGTAGLLSAYATLSNHGQESQPRLYQTTESCAVSGACSPGSVRSEWTCSTPGNPGREIARKDKRGNWEVYGYALSAEANPRLERTHVKQGASSMTGADALEETRSSYTYINGVQLLQAEEQASVLGGPTDSRRTYHVYDTTTARKKAVIQSGLTRERASNGAWTTLRRFVGTFYFTTYDHSGTVMEDALGRVREVHGPCFVSNESATDCPSTTAYPVTKYDYNVDWGIYTRNLLGKVQSYPAGGPLMAGAAELTTSYDYSYGVYNGWKKVTTTEPNGRVIDRQEQSGRVMWEEEQESNVTWKTEYSYLDDKLAGIKRPEGDYDVFCYRTGTTAEGGCTGALSKKLQWTARAGLPSGAGWTEKVVYSYWPDETLKEERYLTRTGTTVQTRRVMKYAADAHRRPTWSKVGEGAGSYTAAKSFDGADNLTGVGQAFNNPPAWCGGVKTGQGPLADGTPLSQLCSSLAYDRANRLVQVDEYPADGVSQRTLFAHDAQGNVSGVKVGCALTETFANCAQPATTYTHDDFGRVVEVSLPHADGPVRYAYDARGNQVVKETAAMRQAGEYVASSYDMLSRLLSSQRVYTGGSEALYLLAYDSAGDALPAGCPLVANARTEGRLRYRKDSFGRTWFSYDRSGRVLQEIRVRSGESTCGAVANANPHTFYSYTLNGNLQSVTYPNGRTVTYVYGTGGNTNRVSAVDVTLYDGTAWTTQRLLSNVTWEPYGGLRGYTLKHPTTSQTSTVEYALGDNSSVPPAGCSTSSPSATNSDLTGRLRGLRVSSGSVAMGAGTGDVYQRTYTWKADQVVRTDTCLLGQNSTPMQETYAYDRTLRLTGVGRTAGNFSATGGAFDARTYGYDRRGNRTAMTSDAAPYFLKYATDSVAHKDRLVGWGSSAANSLLGYTLAYDAEGRVTRKADLGENTTLAFEYGQSVGVATESVFRAVEVNGAFYNYYYDALGRRRQKSYPGGTSDEFFYTGANQLLVDRGSSDVVTPVAHYTQEDYVWLGGRPVALVRGKLSTTWTRLADTSADCARNGEAATCGVYFPVTDHLGKPVLMLDGSGKVAGAVDYEPFGQINRVALRAETEHPLYAWVGNNNVTLSEMNQPTTASMSVRMRVLFHLLDTQGVGHVDVKDANTGADLIGGLEASGQGAFWSGWVQPSAGRARVDFNYEACHTDCSGIRCQEVCGHMHAYSALAKTLASNPSTPEHGEPTTAKGVVVEGYEYQRYQTGAQPFWTPLRYPGQYHDAETDLFENWNRYYDPSIGRYLQPEPLLARWNTTVRRALTLGRLFPAYSYALSNPIGFIDGDGLSPGQRFYGPNARDEAAIDALLFIHPSAELHGLKYGGKICQDKEGAVFATDLACSSPENPTLIDYSQVNCPAGSKVLGTYHTHWLDADEGKRFPPFSLTDLDTANSNKWISWLSRADGKEVWRWYPFPIGINEQIYPVPAARPWWKWWK